MPDAEPRTFRTMQLMSSPEELATPAGDARIDAMRRPTRGDFSCWLCQLKQTVISPRAYFEEITFCSRCHPTVEHCPLWLIQSQEHSQPLVLVA